MNNEPKTAEEKIEGAEKYIQDAIRKAEQHAIELKTLLEAARKADDGTRETKLATAKTLGHRIGRACLELQRQTQALA